jgi:hypothetical protein
VKTIKILSLTLCMVRMLIPVFTLTASAAAEPFNIQTSEVASGTNWSFDGTVLTVNNGANIEITGAVSNGRCVVVNGTAGITLNNVSIDVGTSTNPPILLNNGANLSLTLAAGTTNNLSAVMSNMSAGIEVPGGTTLTIQGDGSLIAQGDWFSAGIGGGFITDGGTITINSGTITAIGGGYLDGFGNAGFGAGIGGGFYANGGTVNINGGIVTAAGGGSDLMSNLAAGIGAGSASGPAAGSPPSSGGTLAMNGNGIVFVSSLENDGGIKTDITDIERGIFFVDTSGTVYGNVALDGDLEIPDGYTLTIPHGAVLTVLNGVTLTNSGIINNQGTINNSGTFSGTLPTGNPINDTNFNIPTGIPGITGYLLAMIMFLAISAGLWGYLLRRRIRGNNV